MADSPKGEDCVRDEIVQVSTENDEFERALALSMEGSKQSFQPPAEKQANTQTNDPPGNETEEALPSEMDLDNSIPLQKVQSNPKDLHWTVSAAY